MLQEVGTYSHLGFAQIQEADPEQRFCTVYERETVTMAFHRGLPKLLPGHKSGVWSLIHQADAYRRWQWMPR
jgi:hypothetical protein